MKSSRRLKATALAVATLAGSAIALLGVPAANAGTLAGTATIVDPSTSQPMANGGSHTTWTLKLPTPATCTGDSANGGFFVYSYITAASPTTLSFTSNGPVAPGGALAFPLVDSAGSPYVTRNTGPNTGQVIDFPGTNFTFAAFSAPGAGGASLPAGTYNIGIACAKGGVEDKVWNSQIKFVASPCDGNGELWAVPPANPPTTAIPSAPTGLTATAALFAVNLSWHAPTGACPPVSNYVILRGTSPGSETPIATVGSATSYSDGGHTLDILTTFYYKVQAVNTAGTSGTSNEAHSKALPWSLIPA